MSPEPSTATTGKNIGEGLTMTTEQIWEAVLARLSEKLSRMEFHTWFPKVQLARIEGGGAMVLAPTDMHRNWLSSKYRGIILSNLQAVSPQVDQVYFDTDLSLSNAPVAYPALFEKQLSAKKIRHEPTVRLQEGVESRVLSSHLTLRNFIVGEENRLAHAACMAVAEAAGKEKKYNPLFIYGGVGLGKTHLLQGTANEVLRRDGEAVVVYTTAERFLNELVKAIRQRKTDEFRKKYRRTDVLIIDDVQFFDGKEHAQDELFNTFNDLFEGQKQIIFAADRPPSELTGIADRLRSRMGWGLTVDVQLPSFETRIAIVQQKAQAADLLLPADIEQFLAANVRKTLREVENLVNQIRAEVELTHTPPTLQSVSRILRKLNPSAPLQTADEAKRGIARNTDDIITFIADYFGIPATDILGTSRKQQVVFARQLCWVLCRDVLRMSYEQIGEDFGGKNHTTIMHGVKKIHQQLESDAHTARHLHAIKADLGVK
ncbi:chromosomal replication initiator protein DnaA [Candidatus Peribacteria bacterium]|nr:chromosomal replication initiator protein DnaA [Candidatus Peribacteria bacterium]